MGPNYNKILKESNSPSEAIQKWKDQNGGNIDSTVVNSFNKEDPSAFKGGNNGGTQSSINRTITPSSIAKAQSSGISYNSEMSSNYQVDINGLKDGSALQGEILKQIERESQLHTDINEKLGLTGELSRSYRDSILETVPLAATLGFDIKNITDMVTTLGEKSGRFNLMSQETMEHSLVTTRAFGTTLRDMADTMTEFEKVGYGAADTLDQINAAGRASLSLGLNSKKTVEMLKTDIGKLNEYGFSAGVQGLERMVQKSLEFRMSMSEVFKIADKVMSPDAAIELTANLQVLGGAIGDFNDPLKLMYMATNNVEGLQDALIGAAGNLATYNKEQGKFEITGANLRRAKEMASQLGISYGEFAKGAIASQERIIANNTLLTKGFDMNDKDREFLTNMSQMKEGKMTITIPESLQDKLGKQSEIALNDLSQEQINVLKENRKAFEKMSVEEIAKEQNATTKNILLLLQGAGLKGVKTAKDSAFGRNEYVGNDAKYAGSVPIEKMSQGLKKDMVDFTDKVLKGIPTQFTTNIKFATDGIAAASNKIADSIGKYNDLLRKTLMGGETGRGGLEEYDKKKKEYNERSNPRTNEFVLKSQINVVYSGFGVPITEIKGGYVTGPNASTKKGQ
jgi:hypothetical protein